MSVIFGKAFFWPGGWEGGGVIEILRCVSNFWLEFHNLARCTLF